MRNIRHVRNMRQHRYSPLIGTVFSQRKQEKNIFRVDNNFIIKHILKREYYIEEGNHKHDQITKILIFFS